MTVLNGNEAALTILESMPGDWFVTDSGTRYDGSTDGHIHFATNMRDPRLSMKWGRPVISPFVTEWSKAAFGEAGCESFTWVGEAYGNPILEETLVSADGGRYVLPLPISGSMTVDRDRIYLSRLIHDLSMVAESYKTGMQLAGFSLPEWFTDPDFTGGGNS